MNYRNAQTPDLPEMSEMNQPVSTVNQLESVVNQPVFTDATVALELPSIPCSIPELCKYIKAEFGHAPNANTLRTRWMDDKILPLYSGLITPSFKGDRGLLTAFGRDEIINYYRQVVAGKDGSEASRLTSTAYSDLVKARFDAIPQTTSSKDLDGVSERANSKKQEAESADNANALALIETKSDHQKLDAAMNALADANAKKDVSVHHLTEVEKAEIKQEFLAKKMAREDYLQKLQQDYETSLQAKKQSKSK
jgi:hypothetical protein